MKGISICCYKRLWIIARITQRCLFRKVRSANGTARPKVTTRGWELLVQWKDGSVSWEKLKDLKESNPVEVAEYAVANRIVEEPAFTWLVPHT